MIQGTRQPGMRGWRALEAAELLVRGAGERAPEEGTDTSADAHSSVSMKNEGVIPSCLQFLLLTELGVTV